MPITNLDIFTARQRFTDQELRNGAADFLDKSDCDRFALKDHEDLKIQKGIFLLPF